MQTTNRHITQLLRSDTTPIPDVLPSNTVIFRGGRRTENAFDDATAAC